MDQELERWGPQEMEVRMLLKTEELVGSLLKSTWTWRHSHLPENQAIPFPPPT